MAMRTRLRSFRVHGVMLGIALVVALVFGQNAFAETITHTYTIQKPTVLYGADGKAIVELPGTQQDTKTIGAPMLPLMLSRLYVPAGQHVDTVEVSFGAMQALPGTYTLAHAVSPQPLSMGNTSLPAALPNPTIYGSNQPYPSQTWARASDQHLHGYRIVTTELRPVRYLPASGVVEYATSIKVTVHTSVQKNAVATDLQPRRSGTDLQDVLNLIDNGDAVPFDVQKNALPLDSSRQFLVITTNALKSAFTPLLTHRASSAGGGFTTYITTVEDIASGQSGRDLAEKMRNYIKGCYTNYGTQYVVLGGDADGPQASQAVPTRGCPATVGSYSDSYIPTDYYYACLDGTWDNDNDNIFGESTDGVSGGDIDWLAEVAVGRIPADTTQEVQNAINKIIAYDTASAPYKALLVGENLDSTPTWGGDKMDYVYEAMNAMPRDTLYDRDAASNDWPKSELISLLSGNAYSIVFHLGHSNVTYNMKMSNSDLDSITNTKYQFIYSQGCYSNSYDGRTTTVGSYSSSDSIGEDFLVRNTKNAFAYIGNSRYGWYNFGQVYNGASNLVHRRFAEAVFQSSIRRLGPANNQSKASLNYSDGVYRWLGFEINLMGDPASQLKLSCTDSTLAVAITTPAAQFTARVNTAQQLTAQVVTGCGTALTGGTVQATFSTGQTAVTLYDDGAHQDGVANDGTYGGSWTPNAAGNVTITIRASKSGYTAATATVSGTVNQAFAYVMQAGTYNWVDDSTATTIISSGDDTVVSLNLGFSFPFFDGVYSSVYVCSNGFLSFTTSSPYYSNTAIPNTANPNAMIAPFWDDLVVTSSLGGRVTAQQLGASPNARMVITWGNIRHYGESVTSAPATFQVVLDERTGTITMQYANVTFATSSYTGGGNATVGIENLDGSEGLQYSYNQASLSANQALVFLPQGVTDSAAETIVPTLYLLLQ